MAGVENITKELILSLIKTDFPSWNRLLCQYKPNETEEEAKGGSNFDALEVALATFDAIAESDLQNSKKLKKPPVFAEILKLHSQYVIGQPFLDQVKSLPIAHAP